MNKKSRLRLTSWLLAVVMAISIASPALAVDASVVSESTPAAVNESTPDNSVPESIPAQGNDVPTSTDPPEENQSAADSSSEPKSESRPESESIPDSTSAPDSESTPDSSSAPESESMSDSDSASGSESTPDSESTSSTESDSEAPAFTPLEITEMFTHTEAQPGDTVELYVRLNRDDVAVTYQWQVLDASPGELESPEAIYSYGEGESTDYAFLLDGMTEEELLAINPDAVWPGIEMYYAKKGKQARQRTLSSEPIHIENGTPNYVLNPEAQDIEDTEIAWRGIDGATDSTYPHVVTGDEEDLSYRCVITVTDEAYLTEAAQTETQSGTAEAVMEEAAPESSAEAVPDASASDARGRVLAMDAPVEEAASEEILISDSMYVDIPVAPSEDAPAMFSAVTGSAQDVHLSEDNQWLMGLTQHMEYITAQAYQEYGGEAANNPYWTKISGGARADGSKYAPTSLVDNSSTPLVGEGSIPQGLTPEAAAKQWLRGTDGLSYRMRGVHAYENLLEIPEDKRLVELDHDTFQWRPRKGVESNEIDQAISQYVKAWRQQENPVDVSTSESVVKRKSAIDIAKEQIQNLCNSFKKDPQQYVEYLKFSARFYKYSGRNMMLIYQQKPGANFVASRTAFKDMGYDLKPGQWRHPAWIIRPETKTLFVTADGVVADIKSATVQEKADIQDGKIPTEKFTYFRAAKVYEIGQTTCPAKDYPKILGHGIDDQQHKELYTRLQAVAGMSGFIVSEEPLPSGEFGYCSYNKQIVISDSLGDTQKLATLNHEFAHGLLHLASDLPSAVEEFEAESVALIMQQRLGLPVEDLTVRYVKNALREAGNLPEFSMEESLGRIVKQANYVCDRLELQQLQQQEVMPVQNQAPVIQAQPNFGPTL